MHVHLPKPLHGWRQFAGEVGIIVVGVLIALAAEQLVERLHWNHQVRIARASIHREMAFDLAYLADRLQVAPCVDRQLFEAQQRINAAAENGATPPVDAKLRSPGRLILVGDYAAQQAAQNLVHFPPAELSALGLWYDQMRNLSEWKDEEIAAWANLRLLAPGRAKLGPLDLALLRRDLQTADSLERLTVLNAKREIAYARELGVSPGQSRSDYLHGMCAHGSG